MERLASFLKWSKNFKHSRTDAGFKGKEPSFDKRTETVELNVNYVNYVEKNVNYVGTDQCLKEERPNIDNKPVHCKVDH